MGKVWLIMVKNSQKLVENQNQQTKIVNGSRFVENNKKLIQNDQNDVELGRKG
jgi:hypothetical protein